MIRRKLELLSPAANAETAIQAILHGADAVYIGATSHGARKAASNSLEDIERVVDFAHQYRAKVYTTVNTIIFDDEIKKVEQLCKDLYHIGVDALIVQDMALLRMKIPPIALHASTQSDIRTPEKAIFLEKVGFSQLVLARELSLKEIKEISSAVTIPVETFVHGALCVSYSGRCHASWALTGRSANRGECAQICRFPYTLTDSSGKEIIKNKYLLSLKDFNASHKLKELIDAGVSSFKIEGRLKEKEYVKNVTALYNLQLNSIIKEDSSLCRSSYGRVDLKFQPQADKSFNRGFTSYFLEKRKPAEIASLITPKSIGERINNLSNLNNGDGISFIGRDGQFTGINVNKVEGNRIIAARNISIPKDSIIYRTKDIKWDKLLGGDTATRKISLEITIDNNGVSAKDERGVFVRLPIEMEYERARKEADYRGVFEKLGTTIYSLDRFNSKLERNRFYPMSAMTQLRRNLINALNKANKVVYPFEYRRKEDIKAQFPAKELDYRDNVANQLAQEFYYQHGAEKIEMAAETGLSLQQNDILMTTRHCILRELGMCKKEKGEDAKFKFPLFLKYEGGKFRLHFDCKNCEMQVLKN